MSQDDVRLSPDLIAKLNALASRLTAQGEYEAVDLIDTVVARVTAMPGRELLREALTALTRIGALPRYTDGDNEAQDIARAALSALPERELRYMDEGEQAIMGAALRKSAKVVSRNEPSRELLREALEALQLIANATDPRFLAEHDIHLLHVSEKTFGDCINIARAAADKIRDAMGGE